MRALGAVGVCVVGALGSGCVERRVMITSEPSGALVRVAGREVGRTPVEMGYTFHGWYDVELEHEGYEPLVTQALAKTPWWEYPGPDLVAEAWPGTLENSQHWHFELEPEVARNPADVEADLLGRAGAMRNELQSMPAPAASAPASPESETTDSEPDAAQNEPG